MNGPGLEARVALLEDERAICRTLYAYAHALDRGDEEAWLDCFTEDGVFEARGREPGHTTFRVSGRAELTAFAASHTRPPELWHKHLVVEPLIELNGGHAECTSYFLVLVEHESRPVLRVFGRYRDRLLRGADGVWRFAERVAEIDSLRPGLPPLAWGRSKIDV